MTNFRQRLQSSRRAILAGLGAGTAATFLRPLLGKAQSTPAPQRLLIIHRPIGTVQEQWWPSGSGKSWTASPILSEFEALRDQMVVIRGMNRPYGDWNGDKPALGLLSMMTPSPRQGAQWPNTNGDSDPNSRWLLPFDASIDQLLRQGVPGLNGAPLPSLQLGVSEQSTNPAFPAMGCLSYVKLSGQEPASALLPVISPIAVLQTLRGLAAEPSASAALDQQLFEFLRADVQRLKDRAPVTESAKLEAHLAALRSLETSSESAACSLPQLGALPEVPPGVTKDEALYDTVQRQQLQLVKAAFQCDLTRVITFSFGTGEPSMRFQKILPPGTIYSGDGLYGLSQSGNGDSVMLDRTTIEKYFASNVARLLLDLKNTPEPRGQGSLLDNTLVVYLSECSGISYHNPFDMPVLAFGGKSLGLQGGSFLQFYGERCMPDFWVSVAQAFGYTDLKVFGAAEWNKGPLPGLFG